jgi:hypothetical protein
MSGAPRIRFDYDEGDLVIRIPRDVISLDRVMRFLDHLLREGESRADLADEEVDAIADGANRAARMRLPNGG